MEINKVSSRELRQVQYKLAAIEAQKEKLKEELPHLYGYNWYDWALKFFNSRNKMTLLCAANQISKSSTQMRKAIEWAGNTALWPELWPGKQCRMMWYLYPTREVFNMEWKTKWIEFMPNGSHGEGTTSSGYGWNKIRERGEFVGVQFHSGMTIYFRTYGQNVQHLQSGTVGAIFCFVAGTLVTCQRGYIPIENLRDDDLIQTSDGGVRPFTRTPTKIAKVITRKFSTGVSITGTPDHPFFTYNRGWVPFGELTVEDACCIDPLWKSSKKSSYLKRCFTFVIQKVRTPAKRITIDQHVVIPFMSRYGLRRMKEMYLKATSFITKTLTLSITPSKILNSLPEESIRRSIRTRSGGRKDCGNSPARNAGKFSNQEALKKLCLDFVLRSVGVLKRNVLAGIATRFSPHAQIQKHAFVLKGAPTQGESLVYNITVSGNPTYFANGILVHNCDEELPEEIYDELNMRLAGIGGYFHMVFTATLNQLLWRLAIEGTGDIEKWPDALKLQVSMYDCLRYADGTPGAFTVERIKSIERQCQSPTEVKRRVYGKFVTEVGRKYTQFDASKHLIAPIIFPKTWGVYVGVDLGSGGDGHPPAITFTAIREDLRYGVVFAGWIGDDGKNYTVGDVYEKYLTMKQDLKVEPVEKRYDQQARDFKTISDRAGDTFLGSNKNHEHGEYALNTLFKNGMLHVFDVDPLQKLGSELSTIMRDTPKSKAKDDFADSLRYCVVTMPWDWTILVKEKSSTEIAEALAKPLTNEEVVAMEIEARRGNFFDPIKKRSLELEDPGWSEIEEDIVEWNSRYDL